jgi:hypothetical protein
MNLAASRAGETDPRAMRLLVDSQATIMVLRGVTAAFGPESLTLRQREIRPARATRRPAHAADHTPILAAVGPDRVRPATRPQRRRGGRRMSPGGLFAGTGPDGGDGPSHSRSPRRCPSDAFPTPSPAWFRTQPQARGKPNPTPLRGLPARPPDSECYAPRPLPFEVAPPMNRALRVR